MSVGIVVVVSGDAYVRWGRALYESALDHFRPGVSFHFWSVPGSSGWPAATLYRYHRLLEREPELVGDHLFLSDADMRFDGPVGDEILGELVATVHPGYAHRLPAEFPYEQRPESVARVRPSEGQRYYCGGFVGGERERFLDLARRIVTGINEDNRRGVVARWHDESHLNRALADTPPTLVLPPSYCFPDDASAYPWLAGVPRKLVAIDKTPAERGAR